MSNTSPATNANPGLTVIGAGFGRTGTLSLKAALEALGFGPCYHMTEVFQHPKHALLWDAAATGKAIDWHQFLQGYQATVDWPACTFYQELMQAYPEAKVLLTVRDPEKWYASVISTIYQIRHRPRSFSLSALLFFLVRVFVPGMRRILRMQDTVIWQGTFHGKLADKDYAIALFNQHIAEVKQRVPPEKLLVYDVKEGWEPLCAFLGVPIPTDQPFPHLNDRDSFVGNTRRRRMARIAGSALLASVLALLGIFLFIFRRFLPTLRSKKPR